MIRLGGPGEGHLPPHDPAEERTMANRAVAGNILFFGMVVAAISVAPHLLRQMGFESVLV